MPTLRAPDASENAQSQLSASTSVNSRKIWANSPYPVCFARATIPVMPYVLIVDDEPDSSEFVKRYLNREGFTIARVPNGRAALEELLVGHPDANVLDVRMPEMDG